ncbi:MAG: hypothetical protein M0006_05195 [Magnetospirillum sp.]|nr:hypothetical protein [Magnetospirillum sp.]
MTLASLRSIAHTVLLGVSVAACSSIEANLPPFPWEGSKTAPASAAPQGSARSGEAQDALRAAPVPKPRPAEPKSLAKAVPGKEALPPKLVGLSEAQTIDLLGRPSEEGGQPPEKVWLYRAAGCDLSVHLFPDMEKGGFYALDYTADGGVSRDACLLKIATEARRKGA